MTRRTPNRAMLALEHADRVMARGRAGRERSIALVDRITRVEAIVTGQPSPLVGLAAALRPGADVVVPRHLRGCRAAALELMLSALPAPPDELTRSAVLRLVADIATGLAFAGPANEVAGFALALADLVAAQCIPFAPEVSR